MSVQPYADRFEVGAHQVFVEASQAATHGRMFTPFRFIVVKDGRAAFAVALEQSPADRGLFLFALHDGASASLAGGGLRHPFDYAAAKAAAIPIIQHGVALHMRTRQGLPPAPMEAPWNRQQQQTAPQQWGPEAPAQPWTVPAGSAQHTAEEWFESQQVRIGEEIGWQGGALRLRLDCFTVSRPGLLERLLDGLVGLANLGVHLTTPAQGTFKDGCQTGADRMFPREFGPYGQQTSLRGPNRGVVFEVCRMVDNRTALVRAGTVPMPSMLAMHGSLESLDSEARSFIVDWLDREDMMGAEIPRPREPLEPIDGFSATLAPMSSGSLAVTFHRSAGRYFIRSYGGCIAPVETWRGPFVSSDHGWVPATRA